MCWDDLTPAHVWELCHLSGAKDWHLMETSEKMAAFLKDLVGTNVSVFFNCSAFNYNSHFRAVDMGLHVYMTVSITVHVGSMLITVCTIGTIYNKCVYNHTVWPAHSIWSIGS